MPWDREPDTPPRVRLERTLRLARAATVASVHLGARQWAKRAPLEWLGAPVEHDRALIIVGGFGSSAGYYELLRRSHEAAGVRRVAVMPPVENAFADIRMSAERLASMARLIGTEIDIVAHSEGGLVARWFVKELGGDEIVRRVVTLGTPNRGLPIRPEDYPFIERSKSARRIHNALTPVANRTVIPFTSLALRQMLRGSDFMSELGSEVPNGDTQYLAIRSRWDGLVPYSAADLPDADNVANVSLREGPRHGHHGALASTSQEAFDATLAFIRRR